MTRQGRLASHQSKASGVSELERVENAQSWSRAWSGMVHIDLSASGGVPKWPLPLRSRAVSRPVSWLSPGFIYTMQFNA